MTWRIAGASDEAVEREQRLWQAFQSRERERIEALVAPDAVDVGPGGVHSRDEVIATVERMQIRSFELSDFTARRLGTDFEIVIYRSRVTGTYRGEPFRFAEARCSSFWVFCEAAWQLVHRVECPVERVRPVQ